MSGYLFAAGCAALLCACYLAGRAALAPRWTAAVAAGALCVPAAQFALRPRPAGPASAAGFVSAYLVFAALPLLAGRYVAAQRRAAGRERERERLEIAREMHDSLGRSLSLAAVQAAALEVGDLPAPQRAAVAGLASAIRGTVTELHEILGVLRTQPETRTQPQDLAAASRLIEEFRAAGVAVSARSSGPPRPLAPRAGQTAYRVIEEGLTNAARHAPGQPVSVRFAWEAGTLLLTMDNPAQAPGYTPGSGLADLAVRLQQAGGRLSHELAAGQFRLQAVVPTKGSQRPTLTPLGLAVGMLLLVVLPAVILLGVS